MAAANLILNGIEIPCIDISGQHKAAIVKHQYPGHSGADLAFLGLEADTLHVRATFVGREELAKYDSLREVMRLGQLVIVEHELSGTFNALIEDLSWKEDEQVETAAVEISLVRDGIDEPLQYKPRAVQLRADLTNEVIKAMTADWAKPFAPNPPPVVDVTATNWVEQINSLGLSNAIVSMVRSTATQLARVDAMVTTISTPVSAAFHALAFASDLPGQISLRVQTMLDLLGGRVEDAPDPVVSCTRFVGELRDLFARFRGASFEGMLRVQGAMQAAGTAATIMDADEQRLRAQVSIEDAQTFDERGNWLGRASKLEARPATADQVSGMVTAVRELISESLRWTDERAPLLRMAQALHEQYRNRMVELEQLKEIDVLEPTPLHLICIRNGLPYNAAERLVRLNEIPNPTFVQGRIRIYAR